MVKHIVFWKLRADLSTEERDLALQRIKRGFEALPGKVPGLLSIEIGADFRRGTDASDLVLYSEFESREALAGYATHAEHHKLAPMVAELQVEKRIVDYEI